MAEDEKGPDEKSSDYEAMCSYWEMIEAINSGAEAMRQKGDVYLPKFPNESAEDYKYRKQTAPFTNIYGDVSKNLASKPFAKELTLKEGAARSLVDLCEDIDGQGNNLHVFAAATFQDGIDFAIDWIFVDYTKAPPVAGRPRTQAEETALKLRPYWVHICADRVLAVYSDFIDGKETIIYARIKEDVVEREGFTEKTTNRVRELKREKQADGSYGEATFQVYEKQTDTGGKVTWVSIEGPTKITIGVIALAPFMTGKRIGSTWQFKPRLRDIAFLQIEEFQQESNLKSIMEATSYPMLAGNGIGEAKDDKGGPIRVPAGPRAVLFAPMNANGNHGTWTFIEPSAESVKTLISHLDDTQKNMRDLGMQPLTTANLTVITTANVSVKAHSAVQAWALALKDALELAFSFTILWLKAGTEQPEVQVFTDFGVDFEAAKELDSLIKGQAQGIFSKKTVQIEFKRRGVLSDNFDPDEEELQIASEQQGLEGEQAIDPVTGEVVQPPTRPKVIKQPGAVSPRLALAPGK